MSSAQSRIAFHRVLPIVQVVFYLSMAWLGDLQQRAVYGQWDAAEEAQTERLKQALATKAQAEGGAVVAWDLRGMWDGYTAPATEMLLGVNFPAMLSAIPLVLLVGWVHPSRWLSCIIYGLVVVVFWYVVGRGMDRAISRIRRADQPSKTPSVPARRSTLVLLVCGLAIAVFLLGTNVSSKPILYGLGFWCAFGAVWQIIAMWHLRAIARLRNQMTP